MVHMQVLLTYLYEGCVFENSLDHTFRRHYVFQSISRVFHHTHAHGEEEAALAFQLIRKRETLVS